jgi:hypothetical protein
VCNILKGKPRGILINQMDEDDDESHALSKIFFKVESMFKGKISMLFLLKNIIFFKPISKHKLSIE